MRPGKRSLILLTAKVLIVFFILAMNVSAFTQQSLDYYLPRINYDPNITTTESFFNFEIGEWHLSHGQLYHYLSKICEESERCKLTEYARSHENKPLIYLAISSKENIADLENIRLEHKKLTDPGLSADLDITNMPLVLYQGYSIHGNESSGANAAALIAYYLLSGQSSRVEKLLSNTVILLDPCYNPDGLQRFSTWANSHKHDILNTDTRDREFNEVWPGGRTNHYWFDLNRDWLFTVHPSSKGRIEQFHKWKPDILTDHHEMGSNSTFFFQPGVPSRTNPNTPQLNQDLTESIGIFHAMHLDSIGSSYFTKEKYDDYYYGKGSTYPDINGGIGILFEQASSRGHLRETKNGLLSFPFTIRNQVVTSLSTQEAAYRLREHILKYKRDFYQERYNSEYAKGFYIFSDEDSYKSQYFVEMLLRHDVEVYRSNMDHNLEGISFDAERSYLIPKKQIQSSLVKTIFEKVNEFPDSIFYDISAWTVPLALNLEYAESFQEISTDSLTQVNKYERPEFKQTELSAKSMALAADWSSIMASNFLNALHKKNINVKALTSESHFLNGGVLESYPAGTLIIPLRSQKMKAEKILDYCIKYAREFNIELSDIDQGYSSRGISLGSETIKNLNEVSVAMIVGEGINAYEAGESWYQFDHRLKLPLRLIDQRQLKNADLSRYTHLIMADGAYNSNTIPVDLISDWIDMGGTLLAFRRAVDFARKQGWIEGLDLVNASSDLDNISSYKELKSARDAQKITGAIFNTEINRDHPLYFGYSQKDLAVFKRGTQFYNCEKSSAVASKYSKEPVLSGYCSDENKSKAVNSAAVVCAAKGSGTIIASVDNPNFRAYWLGGSKFFSNMLFMSDLIRRETMLD